MNSALPTETPPAVADDAQQPLWRMRLWRKHVWIYSLLVIGSLLSFGVVESLFAYRDAVAEIRNSQAHMAREVRDAVLAAVASGQRPVQVAAALPWDVSGWLDEQHRHEEFARALRLAPLLHDLRHFDGQGRLRSRVSRSDGADAAARAPFLPGRGPDDLGLGMPAPRHGSVVFDKGYEPLLQLVLPDPRLGAGMTVARINLRSMARELRDVLRTQRMQTYAVDAQGQVVLHADTALMLEQRRVPADWLLADPAEPSSQQARTRAGLDDAPVLASALAVPSLGWQIVVEQPRADALLPVWRVLRRTAVVTLVGIVVAVLLAVRVVGQTSRPIKALHQGAQALAARRLDTRINIRTGDELEDLATQFNTMAGTLQTVYREQSLRIAEKTRDLELANRHKSEFLAHMSHELRSPLNAVIGCSQLLEEEVVGPLNDEQKLNATDIRQAGEHLKSLINQVLDLAKIEAGQMALNPVLVNVADVVGQAASLMREQCLRKGLRLSVACDPGLPSWWVDPLRLKQIVLNLLGNAVKFTPRGGDIALRAGLDAQGQVCIEVRDSGVGIAPADQGLIFEEFRQVGDDTVLKAEGTGLGLPLVRRLAGLHGGTVTVHSALGQGATFRVTLPPAAEPLHPNEVPA